MYQSNQQLMWAEVIQKNSEPFLHIGYQRIIFESVQAHCALCASTVYKRLTTHTYTHTNNIGTLCWNLNYQETVLLKNVCFKAS